MRFLQDVISNRRRQRDWTNPWPLICSGSRRPVIPAMVSPPISALFPVVSTERLRVVLEGKSHLCPFCWTGEHVKMQTAAATFILPLSSPSQHYLITDEPQHTHASRIWVGIPPPISVLRPNYDSQWPFITCKLAEGKITISCIY